MGVCVGGGAGVVDGGMAETAMASLISSSYSFQNSADAVNAARSCADNWSIVSLVGVVEGEMAYLCVGGGGGCVCCGGWGGCGWFGGADGCGGGGGDVGGGG